MNYNSLYQFFMQTKTMSAHAKMTLKRYENVDPTIAVQELEEVLEVFRKRVEEDELSLL